MKRHVGIVVDDIDALSDRFDELEIDGLDYLGLEFRDPWGKWLQCVVYEEIQFTKAEHILAGI